LPGWAWEAETCSCVEIQNVQEKLRKEKQNVNITMLLVSWILETQETQIAKVLKHVQIKVTSVIQYGLTLTPI